MVGREKVSVVVPNLNNAERLQACLKGILHNITSQTEVEVIVVDNGSTDGSEKIAANFPVIFLQETDIITPFAARNTGIAAATGEIIILLDSNCVPLPGWLNAGLSTLRNDNDIVGGPLRFESIPKQDWLARFDRIYATIYPEDIKDRSSLPSGNLFIKKRVFDKVGLFLPHARGLGDIEWTNRAHHSGFRLGWATTAEVLYPAKTGLAFLRKMYRLGKGKKELQLYRKGTVWTWRWIAQILKNVLPPAPTFVDRMHGINQREQLGIPLPALFGICWLTKWMRGLGMLLGDCSNMELTGRAR